MMRTLLLRGMLAGALAGVLACLFAKVFGEPQIDRAIGFEDHLTMLAGHPAGAAEVSRGVQSTVGLLLACVVYGVALGGILSLVFAYAYGRVSAARSRVLAAGLAGAAFVTITLVPFLKYPASPPAASESSTIDKRTVLFFVMIAISICAAIAARRVWRAVGTGRDGWTAALAGAGTFVLLVAVAGLVLPSVNEVPRDFPADVLWRFRLSSLGLQVVLWTSLGLIFGALAERVVERPAGRPGAAAPDLGA